MRHGRSSVWEDPKPNRLMDAQTLGAAGCVHDETQGSADMVTEGHHGNSFPTTGKRMHADVLVGAM